MCFASTVRVDHRNQPTGSIEARAFPDYTEALLLYFNIVAGSCSSAMVRTMLARAIEGFDPALSQCADWDFWLRLSGDGCVRNDRRAARSHIARTATDERRRCVAERDTFAALDKFFASPGSTPYRRIRAQVYGNHWMICSGSYLHDRGIADSVRCMLQGIRAQPASLGKSVGTAGAVDAAVVRPAQAATVSDRTLSRCPEPAPAQDAVSAA